MFNLSSFVIENLTVAYTSGQMTATTVNLTAVNYMIKGVLSEPQVAKIGEITSAPIVPLKEGI